MPARNPDFPVFVHSLSVFRFLGRTLGDLGDPAACFGTAHSVWGLFCSIRRFFVRNEWADVLVRYSPESAFLLKNLPGRNLPPC